MISELEEGVRFRKHGGPLGRLGGYLGPSYVSCSEIRRCCSKGKKEGKGMKERARKVLGEAGEDEREKSDDACFSNGQEVFDGGLCLGSQLVTMCI